MSTTARTLLDLFRRQADGAPSHPAVSWRSGSATQTLTWSQYRDLVFATASGFVELGLPAGGIAAILAANRPEHLIADLAALHCGAATVSLYGTLARPQLEHVVADAAPSLVIVEDAAALARIRELDWVRAHRPRLVSIEPTGDPSVTAWSDLAPGERGTAELRERIGKVIPDDTATLVYTSGTTGSAKGVVLTHANLVAQVDGLVGTGMLDFDFRTVSYLPLAHILERIWSLYLPLRLGGHVCCCPDAAGLAAALRVHRPSCFIAVPRVWEKLRAGAEAALASPMFAGHRHTMARAQEILRRVWSLQQDGRDVPPSLRVEAVWAWHWLLPLREALGLDRAVVAANGAAAMSGELRGFLASIGIDVIQGYGLTETGGVAVSERPRAGAVHGAVGVPVPGYQVRVAADGEIQIRGGGVTKGYRNRPEATAELFTEDAWLHTGDIGRLDEDGRLHVTDRAKEIIVTAAGKNVSPAAIESLLVGRSVIDQVMAVGEARPYVVALITLDPQRLGDFARAHGIPPEQAAEHPLVHAEVQALVTEANRNLSRPEQIKRFRVLPRPWSVEAGELTPTFKPRRKAIHDKYRDSIDALYRSTTPTEGSHVS